MFFFDLLKKDLLFLFLVGIPIFYLELSLGQFTSQGSILCWKMAPLFKVYINKN